MGRIASFHLIREPRRRTVQAMSRLATDRPALARVDGLAFWRLLGTGRGDRTGTGADLSRTAVFCVWDDEADLDRFLESHGVAERWSSADEVWTVRLRVVGGHGTWKGIDPLAELERATGVTERVAVITRADVRLGAWRSFSRASGRVDDELHRAPGLIDVVGIGEAPVAKLATFSLWETRHDARSFASTMPEHAEVIRRTRAERWYRTELFATFEPFASSGTWNGRDPLASDT